MSVAKAQGMTAKEAISVARSYFDEFFGAEPIRNVLLEQLDFDETRAIWVVTFGFDAGREAFSNTVGSGLDRLLGPQVTPIREARTFEIEDATGVLVKMTDA
jgi:hypothetical protein